MIPWEQVWPVVVWSALIMYFGLGVFIIIGGFFDVFKMFRRLDER